MGKSSKKRKRKAQRKQLRQEYERQIRLSRTDSISKAPIPAEVAIGTFGDLQERKSKEENFRLVFATYLHSQCQLSQINKASQTKALIRLLDKITNTSQKTISASGVIRGNIYSDGPYKALFKNLPKDVELSEAQFAGTGRLYFYTFKDLFCIIVIQIHHKNI